MKVGQVIKSAITASALLQSSVMAAECATADCSQRALTFAYTYGYPIYPYGLAVRGTENATTNTLFHQRDLATAANTWLVRPNADTVYSRVFLDVSNNDLEITIPEFGDRYWIWPFYDFYGNNVANIGAINGNPAGKYLVTFNKDNWGVQTENVAAPYKAYINLPTAYALTLARILVEANSDDIDAVRKLQDGFGIEEIKRRPGRCKSSVVAPKLDLSIFSNPEYMPGEVNSIEQSVLKLTAKFAKYNPPIVPGDRAWIAQLLEQAGIQDGVFTQAAGTNLTEASRAANTSASALLSQPGFLINVGGNWTVKNPDIIGEYGSYYQARAQIAGVGYLALVRDEVLYPSLEYGKNSNFAANQAIMMTFHSKPKVRKNGFWSLTAYDSKGYLIPNDLNRASLGDRSALTFPDGTPLSDDSEDGTFQILAQPADNPPPANWTSNWIPTPAGGGVVSLSLRLYGAELEMSDGTWVYPDVKVIDAITE